MHDDKEFEIEFSDETMVETDGNYDEVKNVMTSEYPFPERWVVVSDVFVTCIDPGTGADLTAANFTAEFHYDKKIIIRKYEAIQLDVSQTFELQCFSVWAQKYGWSVPSPSKPLVEEAKAFWMYAWETGLVESEYLDSIVGFRK